VHGDEEALKAAETARLAFEEGVASEGLPSVAVSPAELGAGIPLPDLLVRAGLASSKGDARRLIRGEGARLNDAVVRDENGKATRDDLVAGAIKLSAGKRRHVLVTMA